MTAVAWEEVTPVALNKTWKKVWPDVPLTMAIGDRAQWR